MKKLIRAPYIDQTERYPTGCECVSAVMLLQYLGYELSVDEFIEKYLEKQDFRKQDEKLYGPDPRKVFAGSPYDAESMGCYAPVMVKTLEKFFASAKLPAEKTGIPKNAAGDWEAVDMSGVPMERLIEDTINNDIPVIFWATLDLKEYIPGPGWILADTGETFTWRSNEHCMLLVGYDEERYYFNDPWHNHGIIGYEQELVRMRHKEQYEMAVTVRKRLY